MVDTGDAPPTDQDYAVFRELTGSLKEILGRLDRVTTTDLKQLNDRLTLLKLTPISAR